MSPTLALSQKTTKVFSEDGVYISYCIPFLTPLSLPFLILTITKFLVLSLNLSFVLRNNRPKDHPICLL